QDQRSVSGQVLHPEEIPAESFPVVQVDVESQKVKEGQAQVFRGRVASIGDQGARIGLPGDLGQLAEKALDAPGPVPRDDRRANFIADAVGENGRVAAAKDRRLVDGLAGLALDGGAVQKAEVLGPGYIHEEMELLLVRQLKNPF